MYRECAEPAEHQKGIALHAFNLQWMSGGTTGGCLHYLAYMRDVPSLPNISSVLCMVISIYPTRQARYAELAEHQYGAIPWYTISNLQDLHR